VVQDADDTFNNRLEKKCKPENYKLIAYFITIFYLGWEFRL